MMKVTRKTTRDEVMKAISNTPKPKGCTKNIQVARAIKAMYEKKPFTHLTLRQPHVDLDAKSAVQVCHMLSNRWPDVFDFYAAQYIATDENPEFRHISDKKHQVTKKGWAIQQKVKAMLKKGAPYILDVSEFSLDLRKSIKGLAKEKKRKINLDWRCVTDALEMYVFMPSEVSIITTAQKTTSQNNHPQIKAPKHLTALDGAVHLVSIPSETAEAAEKICKELGMPLPTYVTICLRNLITTKKAAAAGGNALEVNVRVR